MPLIRFDMIEGRTETEVTKILDISHRVIVDAFQVPEGDRYQIVHQHHPYEMIIKDTGLGFKRSKSVIVITITTRQRTHEKKEIFYEKLVLALKQECNIDPADIMVSMVVNEGEDWSFGFGKAQFLTGEL
ncbi:tautomerase family protein [Clostridium algoriphilum]|uniref:tautomerase family protein n=1 Tax=Clostridium algoriphilum TaxID=198347 RepID=UPI001CF4AEB7|nr:tautomerase family protein [Clostridium algoriphilum]MCB2293667.1 tautomerase family protein [Clostridium algoriphilum]